MPVSAARNWSPCHGVQVASAMLAAVVAIGHHRRRRKLDGVLDERRVLGG
jgi:hypothetical protein